MKEVILIIIVAVVSMAVGQITGVKRVERSTTYQIGEFYKKEFNKCFNLDTDLTLGYCMENTTIMGPLPTNPK